MKLKAYRFDKFGAFETVEDVVGYVRPSGDVDYIVPRHCTLVAPPEMPPGPKRRWVYLERTESWMDISDHRGETWYDWKGRPVVIERLGNPEAWDLTPEPRGAKQ